MKIRIWTSAVAVLMLGTRVHADQAPVVWSYDNNVKAVACDVCDPACGAADACCGDGCCGDGCDCGDGCGCGDACGGCCLGAFSLAGLIGLEDSPWDIGGWTQLGYHDNVTPLSVNRGDVLSFNDVPDALNLQQQWFYIERAVDGSDGLDIGGRFDVMYGTDAQKTQAFGNPPDTFDFGWNHGVYGWAMPQLYGELAYGDLSVKIGHFFTLVGYEVVPATGNFFYSHSYTMFNSEPFTHTGVLGTWNYGDALTLYGGWTLGWDTGFDQLNQGNSWLGGFSLGLGENVAFTYINTYGNFGWRDGGDDNSYSHSCVLTASLTDNLEYVFQSDLVDTSNPGVSEYDTIGINQYLFYGLTDVFKLGQRIEWWKADGVSYYESTSGVNVQLLDNFVMRPEYRYDWSPGGGIDEETVGVDMILSY